MRHWEHLVEAAAEEQGSNRLSPDYIDLFLLYQAVCELKPRTVYEIGSGYSTLVLNSRFHNEVDYQVVSLESSSYWLDSTRKMAREVKLPVHIEHYVPSHVSPLWIYRKRLDCDLLYIDGPESTEDTFVTDVDISPQTTILIDGRLETVVHLASKYGRRIVDLRAGFGVREKCFTMLYKEPNDGEE